MLLLLLHLALAHGICVGPDGGVRGGLPGREGVVALGRDDAVEAAAAVVVLAVDDALGPLGGHTVVVLRAGDVGGGDGVARVGREAAHGGVGGGGLGAVVLGRVVLGGRDGGVVAGEAVGGV